MITFVTVVRPFIGEFDALQRMAIQSWREAVPRAQVILFGDEPGTQRAVYDLGVTQCHDLTHHASGSPLADRPFALGERYAAHGWICYISADITLGGELPDVLAALADVERPFVIGQRWDIEPNAAPETATLHPPCGVDYFLYRRGTIGEVLPFTVRGGGGDNWLVWKALTAWNMTVIDATQSITAIHVNHAHPEWQNGKAGREGSTEQVHNRKLLEADGMTQRLGINAAPWMLAGGQVQPRQAVAV